MLFNEKKAFLLLEHFGRKYKLLLPADLINFMLNYFLIRVKIEFGASGIYSISNQNQVFVCGYNNFGELGVGKPKDQMIRPVEIKEFNGLKITKIITGLNNFALTDQGVFVWGVNHFGMLGIGSAETQRTPVKIKAFNDINVSEIFVNASKNAFAVTDQGVFAWGNNCNGQLGVGNYKDQYSPVKIKLLDNTTIGIIQASSSTFAIADKSTYMWGLNDCGVLGAGYNRKQNMPIKIEAFNGVSVREIKKERSNIFVLSDQGVYEWEENHYSQLEIDNINFQYSPIKAKLSNPIKVMKLFTESFKSTINFQETCCAFALTDQGVYTWGTNYHGQLGLGHNQYQHAPVKIEAFNGIELSDISTRNNSFFFSDQGIFACRDNRFGQLGIGHSQRQYYPAKVKALNGVGVLAISRTDHKGTFFFTDQGIFACGYNRNNELEVGNKKDQSSPIKSNICKGISIVAILIRDKFRFFGITDRGAVFVLKNNEYQCIHIKAKKSFFHKEKNRYTLFKIKKFDDHKVSEVLLGVDHAANFI